MPLVTYDDIETLKTPQLDALLICSPLYGLVVYVWDIVGPILFSDVYLQLYIGDCLFVVL